MSKPTVWNCGVMSKRASPSALIGSLPPPDGLTKRSSSPVLKLSFITSHAGSELGATVVTA